MRLEDQVKTVKNTLKPPIVRQERVLPTDFVEKLTVEIERLENKTGFSGNFPPLLPFKTIFTDVKEKIKAGFERWIFGLRELRIYVFPFSSIKKIPKSDKFKKNSLEDIFLYRQRSLRQPTYRNFLKLVRCRFEKGMSVYTYVEDNVLQSYIWMDPNPQSYYGSGVDQNIEAVSDSVYVQDAYTNPSARSKGLGKIGFCQIAHDAAQISGKDCLYLAVFGANAASIHAVEKLGSILKVSYFCRTRFGFRKIWKTEYKTENRFDKATTA